MKYHYFYKITNNINNHFYYGIHSTNNLNDGYMGSGSRLKIAYQKYGIENFTKQILRFFDTRKECADYEAEIVNETLIDDINCYNIIPGGEKFNTSGLVTVKDNNGNSFDISINDPKYLSGEYVGITKGKVHVKDKDGNNLLVSIDDPKYLSGELLHNQKGLTRVQDKTGKQYYIDPNDIRLLLNIFEPAYKNTIMVKDKNNKFYRVQKDDPKYLSGEYVGITKGNKISQEIIDKKKKTYSLIHHQQGEKNSQFGTCWIYNDECSKKIKKEELSLFLQNGWKKGRKMSF